MDSPSESECSMDGGSMLPPTQVSREQLQKRIDSLTQQNRVLKVELETYKIRVKVLQEESRALRQASVIIQAKAEQEEEYISNTLLKKIQALKQEKETLAHHYEREEECLTNDLSRKLDQLRQEKCKLEQTLEQEQECLVNKLMRKIEKLEGETIAKQTNLEQLRREMVELENTLEQEQEALVNKLWKRMDKLEAEKRSLQQQLEQPAARATTPMQMDTTTAAAAPPAVAVVAPQPALVATSTAASLTMGGGVGGVGGADQAAHLSAHIQTLRSQVARLRGNLLAAQKDASQKMQQFAQEEKCIREENLRLQQKLQLEVERREALCRHLSESESSLEMDEERHFGESLLAGLAVGLGGAAQRQRTISSPVPPSFSPSSSRPLSPSLMMMTAAAAAVGMHQQQQQQQQLHQSHVHPPRCCTCGQMVGRRTSDRFAKPAIPSPSIGLNTSAPNVLATTNTATTTTAASSANNNTAGSLDCSFGEQSSSAGGSDNQSSSSSSSAAAAVPMAPITQPASPMDTSVYKE